MKGQWTEIRCVVPIDMMEPVSAVLYEFDIKGLSVEDPNDLLTRQAGPLSWDFADINLFSEGPDQAVICCYFPAGSDPLELVAKIKEKIRGLRAFGFEPEPFRVEHRSVQEEDWATAWKKYYKPVKVGRHLVVKPTWENYQPDPQDLVIEMDPGMAFGTGTHETTRLCLTLLEDIIQGGEKVFDIGTGSGILAIAAKMLGASEVTAIDLDPVAVDAARINAELNQVAIGVVQGDLLDQTQGKADVIIANIIADVIILLSGQMETTLKKGGLLVASGIIHLREEEVLAALKANGFEILDRRDENDWRAILAKKL